MAKITTGSQAPKCGSERQTSDSAPRSGNSPADRHRQGGLWWGLLQQLLELEYLLLLLLELLLLLLQLLLLLELLVEHGG